MIPVAYEPEIESTAAYPKSSLNGPAQRGIHPKPGERVSPAKGEKPPGSGSSPRFRLHAIRTADVDQLIQQFDDLIEFDATETIMAKVPRS